MDVALPATYSDLTLAQAMTLYTSHDQTEWVSQCSGLTIDAVRQLPVAQYERACKYLFDLKEAATAKHQRTFTLEGNEYGFIPDWTKFTTGEWIDMERYTDDWWANADKIMALLYRRVVRRFGSAYTIAEYTAEENAEVMRQMPAEYANGALVFFWTIKNRRLNGTRQSLLKAARQGLLLPSGDGITRSTSWRTKVGRAWTLLRRNLSKSRFSTSRI